MWTIKVPRNISAGSTKIPSVLAQAEVKGASLKDGDYGEVTLKMTPFLNGPSSPKSDNYTIPV